MGDRFLEFVNNDSELNKMLDSFILDNAYYGIELDASDIFGSSFVKDLVSFEFKQSILELLDVFSLEDSRESGKSIEELAQSAWINVKYATHGKFFELTDDKALFDISDVLALSPKVTYSKDDGLYSLEISSTLKYFPNVRFTYVFYCYDYNLDVDGELLLTFIGEDGIPEDECRFESDCSYQWLLADIYDAFDKLSEDKYRFGDES